MKIAMLAPFEERVPPPKYGGTELVVYNLVEQLVQQGHDVTLYAVGTSTTSARLTTTFPREIRILPEMRDEQVRRAYYCIGIGKVLRYLLNGREQYDIVHNHIGWWFVPFLSLLRSPSVTTLHGPLNIAQERAVYLNHPTEQYISISYNQRKPLPNIQYAGNVYNGIQVENYHYVEKPDNYFVFLGRMSPEKGPVEAIQLARKAGVRLIMAAKVDPVDQPFFDREVQPLIDGKQIQFIGEIGLSEKVQLLSHAKGLLAPVTFEEPFGMYFIEAMGCGTPVIALNRGSVPEVIQQGKTGFVCNTVEEMLIGMQHVERIDRRACYQAVNDEYSPFRSENMAKNYLGVYTLVMQKSEVQEPVFTAQTHARIYKSFYL
jgi:glycosyltransferase involved in cell wall biosynthesis